MTQRISTTRLCVGALAALVVFVLAACNEDSGAIDTIPTISAGVPETPTQQPPTLVPPTPVPPTPVPPTATAGNELHPPQSTDSSTAMGFSDFSYAANVDALLETYVHISRESNLISLHLDGGVPWPEALAGERYADSFANELGAKAALFPENMTRFVSITPINFDRNDLAAYRGATANEPLPEGWEGRLFDHPEVVEAYLNYARAIIDGFSPDYFAYAIEANYLATFSPDIWGSFVFMAGQVYRTLKAEYPDLPLIITLNNEEFLKATDIQGDAIADILPYTDLLAVSTYPFFIWNDANRLAPDYFNQIIELAPDKPFAISETGWPAQRIPDEGDILVDGNEEQQAIYMQMLLEVIEQKDARFVVWFFTRDFDELWDSTLSAHPAAGKLRMFRDLGLLDGEGNPRPALELWRTAIQEP